MHQRLVDFPVWGFLAKFRWQLLSWEVGGSDDFRVGLLWLDNSTEKVVEAVGERDIRISVYYHSGEVYREVDGRFAVRAVAQIGRLVL
jgi:hypothetical protein